ncbi:MAG TPA: FAD-binding oxidoreductase [Roseiarcus sp.]|jgi:FAD/FMN-containing dehydrogenase
MSSPVPSWNRLPKANPAHIVEIADRFTARCDMGAGTRCIAYGSGRSYGDVCLNDGGTVLRTLRLDHFIAFDRATGRLKCEAGVQLAAILDLVVPMGWFLPVTPGTRFVTVGGAVANDVHGKNHHVAGSFGHHVTALELVRSNGERIVCGPDREPEWFAATVGGLGLTGLITWVELALIPISNPFMVTEALRFRSLDEFWAMNGEAERDWPYTVSWIDCTSKRGRGILHVGRHAPPQPELPVWRERRKSFPVDPPVSLINRLSLRAFNTLYYNRPLPRGRTLTHYVPYFYPLDAMENWNRIYGARGFFQYQCVLPRAAAVPGVAAMLEKIAQSGLGSFLAVLKTFGDRPSLGMLSFPRAGATLALDFANEGEATEKLFERLDAIVREAGGALYPGKDARMPPAMFRAGFPASEAFGSYVDPQFSSGFWRRVTEHPTT